MNYLKESIVDKGLWYRPEVFEDEDLNYIRNEELFKVYEKISYKRYLSAKKYAKTICTWHKKTKDKLIVALHGNQQNIGIIRDKWKFVEDYEYQVEYIQSKNLDSYDLFRWEENEEIQIDEILEKIPWSKYKKRILGGFSSGCNEILKTILKADITCEKVILVSPWIPIIKEYLQDILEVINKKDIIIQIICGKEDKDCYPLVELIKANSVGNRNIQITIVEDVGHEFPESFKEIIKNK